MGEVGKVLVILSSLTFDRQMGRELALLARVSMGGRGRCSKAAPFSRLSIRSNLPVESTSDLLSGNCYANPVFCSKVIMVIIYQTDSNRSFRRNSDSNLSMMQSFLFQSMLINHVLILVGGLSTPGSVDLLVSRVLETKRLDDGQIHMILLARTQDLNLFHGLLLRHDFTLLGRTLQKQSENRILVAQILAHSSVEHHQALWLAMQPRYRNAYYLSLSRVSSCKNIFRIGCRNCRKSGPFLLPMIKHIEGHALHFGTKYNRLELQQHQPPPAFPEHWPRKPFSVVTSVPAPHLL